MKRRIHCHGSLRALCPEPFELDTETVAEAINGLCKLKGIKVDPVKGRQRVKVVGCDTQEDFFRPSDLVDIHIVPAFMGGKKGFFQIIIGAVEIIAGAVLEFVPGMQAVGTALILSGAGMLLGGLIQLLFPMKQQSLDDTYYLGAPGNTVKIGTRIPLLFGTFQAFGQYLSYNVDALAVTS